jgi:hypothetical protein
MNPARRVFESETMRASRSTRSAARRGSRARKRAAALRPVKAVKSVLKPALKPAPVVPQLVLYRLCKPGWAVTVEKAPNSLGTRFVCPFCPLSHRVPGPVRGFRKARRAKWIKLHRVEE